MLCGGVCHFGVLRRILFWDVAVAVRTWHVEDDGGGLGVHLFGDGGEGTEELVGDVGEDGGAAGGDFVLREEEEQAREEVVDLCGGGEVVEVDREGGGDFCGIGLVCGERRVSRECFSFVRDRTRLNVTRIAYCKVVHRRNLGCRWCRRDGSAGRWENDRCTEQSC